MIIYLLRHTKPDVPDETFYGHTDVDVVEEDFKKNAPRIKKILPVKQIDKIISSPLQRCTKLAGVIADGQEFSTEKRIMEMNFGDWEMKNWNKIDQSKMEAWTQDFVNANTPNGESHYQLYKRAEEFWKDLIKKSYNKVCVVTHAGIIRSLLSLVLEMPIRKGFSIKLHYNELVSIEHIEKDHYRVEFITNEI